MKCEICGAILETAENQNGTLCVACYKTYFEQQITDKPINDKVNKISGKSHISKSSIKKDSFKIYYRVVIIIVLIAGLPFSLLLLPRIRNIFLRKQPIFHPECMNVGLKIGKALLFISVCISFLAITTVIGTIILMLVNTSGGLSGVPVALAIVLATVAMYPAVIIIELSQINYWKNTSLEQHLRDNKIK